MKIGDKINVNKKIFKGKKEKLYKGQGIIIGITQSTGRKMYEVKINGEIIKVLEEV